MPIDYIGAAEVGKDELAQLLGLWDMEQKADSLEAKTRRLLALAERVLKPDDLPQIGDGRKCR